MSVLRGLVARSADFSGFGDPWGPYGANGRIPPPGLDAVSGAGTIVTERTALQIIDVLACVSLRAESISMLPGKVFRRSTDANNNPVRTELSPQPSFIAQPDPEISASDYWLRSEMSLMLRGNAYSVIIERDQHGYPTAVHQLHPDDVRPQRSRTSGRVAYHLVNGDIVDKTDMIHVPWVALPGAIEGLSPIGCARRGLGKAIATENYGASWFRDGASPSSVLETDQELDAKAAKDNVARWTATHGGRRKPALLSGGLKWRAVTITPEESQFLQTAQANTNQISRLFRIPPHMIGELDKTTSWGKGIEEQGIGFVVYTLGPSLTRYEAAYTPLLPKPQYLKFNVGALLRGNTKDRYLAYAMGRQWGWLSTNDIRSLEDLPLVEGGDTYLQPMNMIDAGEAMKQLLQPAPEGGQSQ